MSVELPTTIAAAKRIVRSTAFRRKFSLRHHETSPLFRLKPGLQADLGQLK